MSNFKSNQVKSCICGGDMKIVKETDSDNLDTYLYGKCSKCGKRTGRVFYTEEAVINDWNVMIEKLEKTKWFKFFKKIQKNK